MNLTYNIGLTAQPQDYVPAAPLMDIKHIPGAQVAPPESQRVRLYCESEKALLRRMYADAEPAEIVAALDRSWNSIQNMAARLNLRRSDEARARTNPVMLANAARKAK